MAIGYHCEQCGFNLRNRRKTSRWLRRIIETEKAEMGQISIVFCSDDYLLGINRKYLQHDYFTDIITFDYTEQENNRRIVSGDLMISVDTVRENASRLGIAFGEELNRIMVHGILHLLGYGDKTSAEAKRMRELENRYLNFFTQS